MQSKIKAKTKSDMLMPRARMRTYGPCIFAVSAPCVWNDLPPTLCASSTILFCSACGTFT